MLHTSRPVPAPIGRVAPAAHWTAPDVEPYWPQDVPATTPATIEFRDGSGRPISDPWSRDLEDGTRHAV